MKKHDASVLKHVLLVKGNVGSGKIPLFKKTERMSPLGCTGTYIHTLLQIGALVPDENPCCYRLDH
jgi:hypothetical protein